VTVGAWADDVFQNPTPGVGYIKVGIDTQTATLWSDQIAGSGAGTGTGVFFDANNTGTFIKPDWLTQDGATQFSFWSVRADEFNGGAPMINGWDNTTSGTAAAPKHDIAFTLQDQNGDFGTSFVRTWFGEMINGDRILDITRKFTFNYTGKFFTWETTLNNNSDPNLASSLTDIHNVYYATGFDPGPGGASLPNTDNSYVVDGVSYRLAASFGFPAFETMTMKGQGVPYMSTSYIMNPVTLYNTGAPFGGPGPVNNDDNVALAFKAGFNGTFDLAAQSSGTVAVTYSFDKGVNTPEVGTFALMGLSMLPMAGLALRRRRKSA
jgi:hypothetical protein